MRFILILLLTLPPLVVKSQTTIFSDDFSSSTIGVDWLLDINDGSYVNRSWQISPDPGCTEDLRISDDAGCDFSLTEDGASTFDGVVYVYIDATGYQNLSLDFLGQANISNLLDAEYSRVVARTSDPTTDPYGDWVEITSYQNQGAPVANTEDLSAYNNMGFYLGFQHESDDSQLLLGNPNGQGDVTRFVIDDVVLEGDPLLAVGEYYWGGDVDMDLSEPGNWLFAQNQGLGYAEVPLADASGFVDTDNSFTFEERTINLLNGTITARNPVVGGVLTQDWQLAYLLVPTGSEFDNLDFTVEVDVTLFLAGKITYSLNGTTTVDFPFDKLLSNMLVGELELAGTVQHSCSEPIVNGSSTGILSFIESATLEISGGGDFSMNTINIPSPTNNNIHLADGSELTISNELAGPTTKGNVFSASTGADKVIFDGINFTGLLELKDLEMDFQSGTSTIDNGAKLYWSDHSKVTLGSPYILQNTDDLNPGELVLDNHFITESGDDISILAGVDGTGYDFDVQNNSVLELRYGTIEDIVIQNGGEFRCAPVAGAISNLMIGSANLSILAGGKAVFEDGAQVDMTGSAITVEEGPSPFSQGGSFVDLTTAGNLFAAGASTVNISNNIGNTPWTQYTYWGTPTVGINLNTIPNQASAYEYTDMQEGDAGWVFASGVMAAGRGYAIQQAGGDVVTFTGSFNSGPIAGPQVGDDGGTENWTLVSNPYPSALHAGSFLSDNNVTINGAIYIWDQGGFVDQWGFASSDYTVVNGLGVVAPDATGFTNAGSAIDADDFWIPTFQGFFVEGLSAAPAASVLFTNAMRDPALANPYSWSFKNGDAKKRLWLSLRSKDGATKLKTSSLIGFEEDATLGWDKKYDATSNKGDLYLASQMVMLDHLGNITGLKDLVIQGLPTFTGNEQIPFKLSFPSAGNYDLFIEDTLGFAGQEIWIHDQKNGNKWQISESPYVFEVGANEQYRHIEIHFREPGTVSVLDHPLAKNQNLWRVSDGFMSKVEGEIKVYDFAGRLVQSQKIKVNQEFQISDRGQVVVQLNKKGRVIFHGFVPH